MKVPGKAALGVISTIAVLGVGPAIIKAEGWVNDPYWDVRNVRTVCAGETHNVEERRYTDAECATIFNKSLKKHGDEIAKCLPANTPISAQMGFLSIGYNIGSTNFCKSSMSRKAWAGDFKGACEAISLYVWVDGRDCRLRGSNCAGIITRRKEERATCLQFAA